jgi:8-oxo-dGTP pyrophosphatase MutT (NUDIX family)
MTNIEQKQGYMNYTGRCGMTVRWKPAVTVAAIIERDGRFLLIEEHTSDGMRLNQPAGHLDPHESLEEAVRRETYEETGHDVHADRAGGHVHVALPCRSVRTEVAAYLRFTFCGTPARQNDQPLDHGILRTCG